MSLNAQIKIALCSFMALQIQQIVAIHRCDIPTLCAYPAAPVIRARDYFPQHLVGRRVSCTTQVQGHKKLPRNFQDGIFILFLVNFVEYLMTFLPNHVTKRTNRNSKSGSNV